MSVEYEKIIPPFSEIPILTKLASSSSLNLSAVAHNHKEVELLYVLKGGITFYIGDQIIQVPENYIIFTNSMVVHTTKAYPNVETEFFLLQFDPSNIYNSSQFAEYKYLVPFLNYNSITYYLFKPENIEEHQQMTSILDVIREESFQKEIAYELFVKSNLYKILGMLYRKEILTFPAASYLNKNNEQFKKIEKIFTYVEENYRHNITVESASQLLNVNYHYFCRLFKEATGKSFIQYLNFVRISVAEKLLITSGTSITNIVYETGFSSISYFNRVFKSIKGCSPSVFREQKGHNTFFE